MNKKKKFFFFGFGQTAKYFIKELIKSNKNFVFCATTTKKSRLLNFNKKKFKSFKFKNNSYDKKLLKELQNTDFILISIPPIFMPTILASTTTLCLNVYLIIGLLLSPL